MHGTLCALRRRHRHHPWRTSFLVARRGLLSGSNGRNVHGTTAGSVLSGRSQRIDDTGSSEVVAEAAQSGVSVQSTCSCVLTAYAHFDTFPADDKLRRSIVLQRVFLIVKRMCYVMLSVFTHQKLENSNNKKSNDTVNLKRKRANMRQWQSMRVNVSIWPCQQQLCLSHSHYIIYFILSNLFILSISYYLFNIILYLCYIYISFYFLYLFIYLFIMNFVRSTQT